MHRAATLSVLLLTITLAACSPFVRDEPPPPPAEPAGPVALPPVATHTFPYDPATVGVVGELQVTVARHEDTFTDLARRFNLGFEEIARANPGVDPWIPGEGTRIVLPTQFVLPDAPHEGLVINVAAMRLFYFPKPDKDGKRVVITHPIGIGKVGWATPVGQTKVVSKRKDPWWTPPASVRREHAEEGDALPARVPPGPDNPLGAYAMNLGWSSYLIHGTNKPAGVGMRASHGCIRLFPEDIASLFERIPVGTKVTVVNQPVVYRWHAGSLYLQSYPPHEELAKKPPSKPKPQKHPPLSDSLSDKMAHKVKPHGAEIDWTLAGRIVEEGRAVAVPVTRQGLVFDEMLSTARLVENRIPEGATWNGEDAIVASEPAAPQPAASAVN
jgi:L,D-transpeptidase ErfK/SrfK